MLLYTWNCIQKLDIAYCQGYVGSNYDSDTFKKGIEYYGGTTELFIVDWISIYETYYINLPNHMWVCDLNHYDFRR